MNGLLIGRFQPFHLGHLDAVNFALSQVENLWISIGSSNKSHEQRNPFTADERKEMITNSIDSDISQKVEIFYIPDVGDHEKWTYSIDSIVPDYDVVFSNDKFTEKLYTKRGIKVIPVSLKQRENLSGTNIRSMIQSDQDWKQFVPDGTKKVLEKINVNERLKRL